MSEIEWAQAIANNAANYAAGHPGHDDETERAARRLAYIIETEENGITK